MSFNLCVATRLWATDKVLGCLSALAATCHLLDSAYSIFSSIAIFCLAIGESSFIHYPIKATLIQKDITHHFLKFIATAVSPPSIPFHPLHYSLLHQIHSIFISLQNRADTPEISIKPYIANWNKTRHISKAGWVNLVEEKGFQEQAKESETSPTPTVRSCIKTASYTMITYIERTWYKLLQAPWLLFRSLWAPTSPT